jgi:hypothetical protein
MQINVEDINQYLENLPDLSTSGIMNSNLLYDANRGYINTSDVPQDLNAFQQTQNYLSQNRGGLTRGLLGLLLGGPMGAIIGYNSPQIRDNISDGMGGISDLFKNYQDKKAGRLDITSDSAIMPTGIEIGAAQVSDDAFNNSDSDYSGNANDGTSNAGTGSSDDGFI